MIFFRANQDDDGGGGNNEDHHHCGRRRFRRHRHQQIACVQFNFIILFLLLLCVRWNEIGPLFSLHITHTHTHPGARTKPLYTRQNNNKLGVCVFFFFNDLLFSLWYRKRALASGTMLFRIWICIHINVTNHETRSTHIAVPQGACSKHSCTRDWHSHSLVVVSVSLCRCVVCVRASISFMIVYDVRTQGFSPSFTRTTYAH